MTELNNVFAKIDDRRRVSEIKKTNKFHLGNVDTCAKGVRLGSK